jgi:hypothetical protein
LTELLDLEAVHQVQTGRTEDHREAAKAFVEKRTPIFTGPVNRRRKSPEPARRLVRPKENFTQIYHS